MFMAFINLRVIYVYKVVISACVFVRLYVPSELRNPWTYFPKNLIGELGRETFLAGFKDSKFRGFPVRAGFPRIVLQKLCRVNFCWRSSFLD